MYAHHAAPWSTSFDGRDRTSHHQRTKQRGKGEQRFQEDWTWEDILDGKGSWTWEEILAGRDRLLWEQVEALRKAEAASKGARRYEGTRLARKPERQPPPKKKIGGHTRRLAELGWRPEPTPRACERHTGQAPCYALERRVSPVRVHSPVRYIPAPRICRARVSIQPGRVVPALLSRPPVRLLGPVYPAPALRTVSPVRLHSPVRPVPAPRMCSVKITIQPGWVVQAPSSRPPVRLHGPVYPVPLPRTKHPVCLSSLVSPVPAPRTKTPVCLPSLVSPVPAARTRPPVCLPSLVSPVAAPRTRLPIRRRFTASNTKSSRSVWLRRWI
ncbi:uncharacterized protein [Salvelinus sp. IW2-2015]|uniref:uncharacterized protein isoform X2 n=1 Tax=Salvelinus sp. IW2-2015 TaxID=2691554 RepID=UPI0038D4E2DC